MMGKDYISKKVFVGVNDKYYGELTYNWEGVSEIGKAPRIKEGEAVYFENVEALRKAITPVRLEILKVIKHRKPTSIYMLAKYMKKDFRNVHAHVIQLSDMGLIELKRQGARDAFMPVICYDELEIRIPLLQEFTQQDGEDEEIIEDEPVVAVTY